MTSSASVDLLPIMSDGLHDFRNVEGSKAFMQVIKDALAEAGVPRTSRMNGGEVRGYTQSQGSTGFSVSYDTMYSTTFNGREYKRGEFLNFHVVISGKAAGLAFREYEEEDGDETYDLHDPINPESLSPRISKVFANLGLEVLNVTNTGHQTMWDDDVDYNITTKAI